MKCPKCEAECGWISKEDEGIYMREDGSVQIGDGSRYSQKIKMKCNNPECDAVVNIYLDAELEASKVGEAHATGAREMKENFEKTVVKKECESCGKEMMVSLWPDITREGNFTLRGNKECLECNRFANFMSEKIVVVDPREE